MNFFVSFEYRLKFQPTINMWILASVVQGRRECDGGVGRIPREPGSLCGGGERRPGAGTGPLPCGPDRAASDEPLVLVRGAAQRDARALWRPGRAAL